MKCKNCGATAELTERYCPTCGEELAPKQGNEGRESLDADKGGALAQSAKPEEEITSPAPSGSGFTGRREEDSFTHDGPAAGAKKSRVVPIVISLILIVGIVVTLFATGLIPLPSQNKGNVVMAVSGDLKLTNSELSYYYWDEYYYLYSNFGSYMDQLIDPELPLDQQQCTMAESGTWHDYFTESAVDTWASTMRLASIARGENHTLDEVFSSRLADMKGELESQAQQEEFASVNLMLKSWYDSSCDFDGYYAYLENVYFANSYVKQNYDSIVKSFEGHPITADSVDVRHILLSIEGCGSLEDARAAANDVYALWEGDPTEENFAALAGEYTQDPGSAASGGLYTGVYPGDMVDTFDAWCFDPSREVGDHGIVETEFGCHIMYLSAVDGYIPEAEEEYSAWIGSILNDIEYQIFSDKVSIEF